MALTSRRADDFERALRGAAPAPAERGELDELVALARRIPQPGPVPRPEFVERLRAALVERGGHLDGAPAGRPAQGITVVLPSPRRLLPALATAAAVAALLVAGISSRALPGDRLYPVKLGIGDAQVRTAGTDLGRGRALLGQVDERLDEAEALVSTGDPLPTHVDLALSPAGEDLATAQRLLLAVRGEDRADALRALAAAAGRTTRRLDDLGPRVPRASQDTVARLAGTLTAGQLALAQQLERCGTACADLRRSLELTAWLGPGPAHEGPPGAAAPTADSSPGPEATAARTAPGTATGTATRLTSGPASAGTRPGAASTAPGVGAPVPGVEASVPGAATAAPAPRVRLPQPTASTSRPAVTLPAPSVTVGTVTVTGPSVSVPAVPGPSGLPVPTPTVGARSTGR